MSGVKGRSGRKAGYVHAPATREKIRSGMLLNVLEKIAAGELKGDPKRLAVRASAATALLRKCLPDLSATDLTSKGEAITVVRRSFKRPEQQQPKSNGESKNVDTGNGGGGV